MRTLAIGDIHGCAMLLDRLLEAVQPTLSDTLIFLGDYIDRGPDSRGVLDRLIKLRQRLNVVCIRGNHDLWMVRARKDASERKMWLQVGGAQTLGSYGSRPGRSGSLDDVPEEHWHFLKSHCVDYFQTDHHIYVHANLQPDTPLDQQTEEWLSWAFLDKPTAHMSGKIIICGHTSQKSGSILDLGTAVCIDTFAYGGGKLTCFNPDTRDYWQADILGRVTTGVLASNGPPTV